MSRKGAINQAKRDKNKPEIFAFAEDNNFSIEAIAGDWHYRLDSVMDVYPTRKRYCWLPEQAYGSYADYEDLGVKMITHLESMEINDARG